MALLLHNPPGFRLNFPPHSFLFSAFALNDSLIRPLDLSSSSHSYAMSYALHSLASFCARDYVSLKGLARFYADRSDRERTCAMELSRYQVRKHSDNCNRNCVSFLLLYSLLSGECTSRLKKNTYRRSCALTLSHWQVRRLSPRAVIHSSAFSSPEEPDCRAKSVGYSIAFDTKQLSTMVEDSYLRLRMVHTKGRGCSWTAVSGFAQRAIPPYECLRKEISEPTRHAWVKLLDAWV